MAYRRYRESICDYWTVEQLARLHWEALYAEVSLERQLGVASRHMGSKRRERYDLDVRLGRVTLCTQLGIPEESVPTESVNEFYTVHAPIARLPLQHPGARLVQNSMSSDVVGGIPQDFRRCIRCHAHSRGCP